MKSLIASIVIAVVFIVNVATAQQSNPEVVWIQIEAHPSLSQAQRRARSYTSVLPDVNGFSLGGSWYGVMLGPYVREDAEKVLRSYRAERKIPQDSYISISSTLGQQFWPVGADLLGRQTATATPLAQTQPAVTQPTISEPEPAPQSRPEPVDETPAQARRSERQLTSEQRKNLQIALKWAGFYSAAIDGAYGPGTRRSMADWQRANGLEGTGILTTMQRQDLLDQYNAPLISVGLQTLTDAQAGIEMMIPASEVGFSRYEPPFAHYPSTGNSGIQLLLISQPGDQTTLFGLYDILQTLEIVPLDGARDRKKDSFVLEGRNANIVSHTEAKLKNGQIKGFTLIWPTGDEERRTRVLAAMQDSFTRLSSVLDPAAGADAEQRIDLVSGLEVRKPRISRSGFFVDTKGAVVTMAKAVNNCTRITLDHDYQAQLVTSDENLGVAILRPVSKLAPVNVGRFSQSAPRINSDVAVAGYSFEGVLSAPTVTYGTLADVTGLRGETGVKRLALAPLAGDAGGPVFDAAGGVMGMLLPRSEGGQRLPDDVSFAADADAIRNMLNAAGIRTETQAARGSIAPEDMIRQATGMTVLVSCWN
jgi:Trypsin-like peptidase domain/Putative peptidoglycan binding domain